MPKKENIKIRKKKDNQLRRDIMTNKNLQNRIKNKNIFKNQH